MKKNTGRNWFSQISLQSQSHKSIHWLYSSVLLHARIVNVLLKGDELPYAMWIWIVYHNKTWFACTYYFRKARNLKNFYSIFGSNLSKISIKEQKTFQVCVFYYINLSQFIDSLHFYVRISTSSNDKFYFVSLCLFLHNYRYFVPENSITFQWCPH